MKKTTLAVPAGSARVDAFIAEARASGRSIAELSVAEASRAPAPPAADASSPDNTVPVIPWNPLSFASARAAIVEAETALGGSLDELVLFVDPPRDLTPVAELTPKAIESTALTWVAGHVELIREAAKRFGEKSGGTVMMVVVHADRGPLGAMAEGASIGLAEGILGSSQGNVRFIAVRDESTQPELLARQVVKLLDEPGKDSGRVLRFGGKAGLFNRG